MSLSNRESNLAQHLNLQLKPPQGPPHDGSNLGLDQANPHTWRFAQKGMSYPISIFFPFFYFFFFHLFLLILFKFYRNSTLQDYSKVLQLPKKMQKMGKLWIVATSKKKCKEGESFGVLQLPKNNAEKGKVLECCNYQKKMKRKGEGIIS